MKQRVGLRVRLVMLLACLLAALVAVHVLLLARNEREVAFSIVAESTVRLSNTVRRSTRYAMLQSRRNDVRQMIDDIGQQPGIEHLRIVNKDGLIAYSADPREINRKVDRRTKGCIECHDTDKPRQSLDMPQRIRSIGRESGHAVLAATEVIYNEPACWSADCHVHPREATVLGVVDVGISLEQAERLMAQAARYAIVIGLVCSTVICLVLGGLVHSFVIRPVRQLVEGTHRVAQGDLEHRIPVVRNDELGQLAASFNTMTDQLRSARQTLRGWGEKLEQEVERKTAELQAAQAQVLRSEKMSSVGLLAAGVAHELNSPLMGILTFAQLLEKQFPPDSRQRKDLEVISSQANRCAAIIRQLLDFSRDRPPERRDLDIHAVVEQAVALVRSLAQFRAIEIVEQFDRSLPPILVDASQMQQVLVLCPA